MERPLPWPSMVGLPAPRDVAADLAADTHTTPEDKPRAGAAKGHADGWISNERASALTSVQLAALDIVKRTVEGIDAAIFVLNPHLPRKEIVHVSVGWQAVTEISETLALGQELGGLLQGMETDNVFANCSLKSLVSSNISGRRACKVLTLHSRAGRPPFWCMLSLSPLMRRGELLLFVGYLQDCSSTVARLKRPPTPRCRSTLYQQSARPFGWERPQLLAKPTVLELDPNFFRLHEVAAGSHQLVAPQTLEHGLQLIKRLGWYRLALEPELLLERLVDALDCLGGSHTLLESSNNPFTEHFVIRARFEGRAVGGGEGNESQDVVHLADITELTLDAEDVEINFVIAEDDLEGTYRVSCTRLRGRTLLFHRVYRLLHRTLALTNEEHGMPSPEHLRRAGHERNQYQSEAPASFHSCDASRASYAGSSCGSGDRRCGAMSGAEGSLAEPSSLLSEFACEIAGHPRA